MVNKIIMRWQVYYFKMEIDMTEKFFDASKEDVDISYSWEEVCYIENYSTLGIQ